MSRLHLKFLGQPRIDYQGQELQFPTRKVLALFIYLVVEKGTHPRDKLVALFWPESEAKLGKAALRNTLARLRRTLRAENSPIIGRSGSLGFDFESVFELDLQLIDAALKSNQLAMLKEVSDSHRGEFLAGFSLGDAPAFDDWVMAQQVVWQWRLNAIFEKLSQIQSEQGDTIGALSTTRRWIKHDPLHEPAYSQLMQLHSLAGDRGAALQTFETCRRILLEKLEVEPTLATIELAKNIRTQLSPPSLWVEARRDPQQTLQNGIPMSQTPLWEMPLTGRANAYAQLTTTYHQLPHTIVVIGEAGIGKTRLVTEFLNWATLQGADIVKGRAFEMGGRLPYQPLIDALRKRIEAENAPDDLLNDIWLAELTRILPELRDRYADLPAYTQDESLARSRLFEAVARLGESLSKRRPLVLFIDDAQWMDQASRDLLHYVGQRWADDHLPIMVLFTMRSETLATEQSLRGWLTRLARDMTLTRLSLKALTIEDMVQLVQTWVEGQSRQKVEVTGDVPIDTAIAKFSTWLFQETTGNPFFISETVKLLFEEGLLQQDKQDTVDLAATMQGIIQQSHIPLPVTVRSALLIRLERLGESASGVLTAITVIGRDCSFELLSAVSGFDEVGTLFALEELLARHLLVEQLDAQRPYTIAHDKIRDVAYTEAGEARRRIYHRRVLAVLKIRDGGQAEMAHHALGAQLQKPALIYSLAAGDEAMQLLAPQDALVHFEAAYRLLNAGLAVEQAKVTSLYTCRGRALELCQQFNEVAQNYEEMMAVAQTQGVQSMELAALMAQARVCSTETPLLDLKKGLALAGKALTLARTLGDREAEAKALWIMMLPHIYGMPDPDKVVEYGEESLSIAREMDLQEQTAFTLNDLIRGYLGQGQLMRAVATMEEARVMWRTLGNRSMLGDNIAISIHIYAMVGDFESMWAVGLEGEALAKSTQNLLIHIFIVATMGWYYWERGEIDKMISSIEATLTLEADASLPSIVAFARVVLSVGYATLGDVDSALSVIAPAITNIDKASNDRQQWFLLQLCRLHIQKGNLEIARKLLNNSRGITEKFSFLSFTPALTPLVEGELLLAEGEYVHVVVLVDELIDSLHKWGFRLFRADAYYLKAQALLGQEQTEAARDALALARQEADVLGSKRMLGVLGI